VGALIAAIVFLVAAVGGGALQIVRAPRLEPNPYISLPQTREPAAAARIAALIQADDARALARALSEEELQALGQSLDPVMQVFEVQFIGAVEKSGEVLSAYVVEGQDQLGTSERVGFVLRVRAGEVVGVN
jgi:hypothetical protein